MDAAAWDERYAATDLVWSAEREPVRRRGARRPAAGPGAGPGHRRGPQRDLAGAARLGRSPRADFSQVGLDKGRRLAGDTVVRWVCADATRWDEPASYDLVLVAYLQLPAEGRRAAVRSAFASLVPGGTFLLVAHDSTNLTEGTGGPQDAAVL